MRVHQTIDLLDTWVLIWHNESSPGARRPKWLTVLLALSSWVQPPLAAILAVYIALPESTIWKLLLLLLLPVAAVAIALMGWVCSQGPSVNLIKSDKDSATQLNVSIQLIIAAAIQVLLVAEHWWLLPMMFMWLVFLIVADQRAHRLLPSDIISSLIPGWLIGGCMLWF